MRRKQQAREYILPASRQESVPQGKSEMAHGIFTYFLIVFSPRLCYPCSNTSAFFSWRDVISSQLRKRRRLLWSVFPRMSACCFVGLVRSKLPNSAHTVLWSVAWLVFCMKVRN